jgi:coenzyme PQQ synthesis protein D (PqqD)
VRDARPLALTAGFTAEEADGGLLIYDEHGELTLSLNRAAALVWRSSDGTRTVSDLVEALALEFGEQADEDQVLIALDELSKHGLIDSGYEERDPNAARVSRRQFIRRVGVVAAVAVGVPIVHSMAAPKPAAGGTLGKYQYRPKKHKKLYLGLPHGPH